MLRLFWYIVAIVVIIGVLIGVVLFFNRGDFGGCSNFADVSSKQSPGCGVARFKDLAICDTLSF
jgi:hypothetical protein